MTKKLFIILGLILMSGLALGLSVDIETAMHKFFPGQEVRGVDDWRINHLAYEEGINVSVIPIDESTLEIEIINSNGGGYKFHSAICEVSPISSIQKYTYSDDWYYDWNLTYGNLVDEGMPYWCEEGFLLFSSGSKDQRFRLKFNDGEKNFKIYTGSGTDEILVTYGDYEIIKRLRFDYFTVGNDSEVITKISAT